MCIHIWSWKSGNIGYIIDNQQLNKNINVNEVPVLPLGLDFRSAGLSFESFGLWASSRESSSASSDGTIVFLASCGRCLGLRFSIIRRLEPSSGTNRRSHGGLPRSWRFHTLSLVWLSVFELCGHDGACFYWWFCRPTPASLNGRLHRGMLIRQSAGWP